MIKDIKYQGYTAVPSDYECLDGELAGSYNMAPEDGAMHPVFPPQELFTLPQGYKLYFLHHPSSDVTNYILYYDGDLYWVTEDNPTPDNVRTMGSIYEPIEITAVGNTLLVLTEHGIYYYLWKGGTYLSLGNKIPEPKLSFSLDNTFEYSDVSTYYIGGGDLGTRWNDYRDNNVAFNSEDKSAYNNVLMAQLNKLMAEKVTNAGKFNMPFFVRYAVRLYDGSLTLHSAPILMLPYGMRTYETGYSTGDGKMYTISFRSVTGVSQLQVAALQALSLQNWEDIITSVDVFISAPLYTYDQAGAVDNYCPSQAKPFYSTKAITYTGSKYEVEGRGISVAPRHTDDVIPSGMVYKDPLAIPQFDNYNSAIEECQNFYLLHSFKPSELTTTRTAIEVGSGYLQSLVTREVMTDDYQSHDTLIPSYSFAFNGRINIANIIRQLFKGYNPFSAFCFSNDGSVSDENVEIYVEIKNDLGNIVVKSDTQALKLNNAGVVYFFYPDTMARKAWIKIGSITYVVDMKAHIGLNGAYFYFLGGLSNTASAPSVSTNPSIKLSNKVYTSEVNNPFFFPLLGINTVGTGDILAICAAVKALSQGQFGQYPLYCFTTEGVWALETSATGSYIARQPVTRDVCTNVDSITQLDDAVLFATNRGIMLLSGSTSQCITDAINSESPFIFSDLFTTETAMTQWTTFLTSNGYSTSGLTQVPFSTFLAGCRMIYDYVHQRIIIYNTGKDYAYIYSLKDHKWGMIQTDINYGINSYPEALAVTDDNVLVNLSIEKTFETIDEQEVPIKVKGVLVTRPLKLDQPDALKTIDTIIQRGKFDFLKPGRAVKPIRSILYGSRDLYNWFLISSSTDHNLRGFSGTPYKYFRIVLLCDFFPDESVYGATIQYKPRYLNRPR